MDDKKLKGEVAALLRSFGFAVTEIPKRHGVLTPDFHAAKNGEDFIVEMKSRWDDEAQLEAEGEVLESGGVASRSGTINRTNAVSGIVAYAVKQIESFLGPAGAFKIVWLHASGFDPELQFMQFRGSLYGLRDILDMGEGKGNFTECYYFDFSDFFRHKPSLDAAILTTDSELQLCINDLSPRAEQLRRSVLVEAFRGGVVDPTDLERQKRAYVADCNYDRRDKNKVISYLQEKYNKKWLVDINLAKHSTMIRVPRLS